MRATRLGRFLFLVGALALAPVAARAEEPEWGEPVGGLSCRLVVPTDPLPIGARPTFTLRLRYEGPKGFHLDRHLEAGRVRLDFADVETGEVRVRRPDDGSCDMPEPMAPGMVELLRPGSETTVPLPVRLLTKEGEQLPPGEYAVTATFEGAGRPRAAEAEPEGRPWTGTVVAAPVRLIVRDAEPAAQEVRVPTRLTFECTDEGLSFGCRREDVATVRVVAHPGYFVTWMFTEQCSVDGAPYEEFARGAGSIFGSRAFLPPETAKRVREGASLAVRVKIEVMESSWPQDWHQAWPTMGDHRVLWTGEIAGVLPDSVR